MVSRMEEGLSRLCGGTLPRFRILSTLIVLLSLDYFQSRYAESHHKVNLFSGSLHIKGQRSD
jgi:hypothetical protein